MASLIKNQILKNLSRFAKNLSPDQIQLSTLKGEGELKNLELNEDVLTELLELPCWLRLSKATCNLVSVRIQWTKLKSVPLSLSLDEVRVEVETCEDLRTISTQKHSSEIASYASGGPYGFIDKVIDGVTVTVNSVHLTLKSHAFVASIQISRIVVESKSPTWQKADLRMTRLKDTDKGELLTFKELSWSTVRIEAKSTNNEELTPLRLITNQASCRITLKKKLADCSVLGCRLVLILDDLLWVLTDDQLKAALHYADSLSGLLKRATEEAQKIKGAIKLQSFSENPSSADKKKKDKKASAQTNMSAKVFSRYDVVETSYHLYSDRIDLHLCDDPGGKGRSCHPSLSDGGAFQVSLSKLQIDYYPFHLITCGRSNWIRYPTGGVHSGWMDQCLAQFQSSLIEMSEGAPLNAVARLHHQPLTRTNAQAASSGPFSLPSVLASNGAGKSNAAAGETQEHVLLTQFRKLMTTNLVVRLNNFTLWKVSVSKGKIAPKEFLSGDREHHSLPDDLPVMHFEYTQFYYPGDVEFPVPPPKLFAYFNPIQLSLDPLTVLWLNAFALNLQKSVKQLSVEKGETPYIDVKVEAIMFRIIIDAQEDLHLKQKDRPRQLQVQASRILAANYRGFDTGSKADLAKCLNNFQEATLFFGTDFPNEPDDINIVCEKFVAHATGGDNLDQKQDIKIGKSSEQSLWHLSKKDLLWTESRDIWCVFIDPLWADFHGIRSSGSRPIPLIDAVPLTMWLYKLPEDEESVPAAAAAKVTTKASNHVQPANPLAKGGPSGQDDSFSSAYVPKMAKIHLLVQVNNLISLQLNHFQLLFLMRMMETVGEISTFLTQDVGHILGEDDESSVAIGLTVPQVDLSLLMPSTCSSGQQDSTQGCPTFPPPEPSSTCLQPKQPGAPITSSSISTLKPLPEASLQQQQPTSAPASPMKPLKPEVASSTPIDLKTPSMNFAVAPGISQSFAGKSAVRGMASPLASGTPLGPAERRKNSSLTSSLSNMISQLDVSLRGSNSGLGDGSPHLHQGPPHQHDPEAMSVKSDDSGDSDNFVVINQFQNNDTSVDATLFDVHQTWRSSSAVELATEVTEDDDFAIDFPSGAGGPAAQGGLLPSDGLSSTPVNPDPTTDENSMISVLTFRLGHLELAHQSLGKKAIIKVQGLSFSGEEAPSIPWEQFQSKFTMRGRGWSESTLAPKGTSSCFQLRLINCTPDYDDILKHATLGGTTTMSLKEKISRCADVFVKLRAKNLPLQFYMSTLNGLVDLFEDEIIPTPIPIDIQIENIALHLIEDRVSPNISSPGSVPIDLAIPALRITRDQTGLFTIQPSDCTNSNSAMTASSFMSLPEVRRRGAGGGAAAEPKPRLDLVRTGMASIEKELQQRAALLAVENANMQTMLDNSSSELNELRAKSQELEATQQKLVKMQQHALSLDRENKQMRQTLQYLQQELIKAGRKPSNATPASKVSLE